MRGFVRECTRFSLCGLNCALCTMQLGGYCPGCGGGEGNQSCRIARCSLEHGGVRFCSDCPDYPCPLYEGFDDADSFITHSARRRDIEQARELGLETYLTQLEERRAILDELLRDYNDGRRKTLYSTAACLLSLGSLREAVEQLRSSTAPESERAKLAAALLNAAAAAEGQSLKLRKKG